jgi:RNase P/RNase MRP subunit p29
MIWSSEVKTAAVSATMLMAFSSGAAANVDNYGEQLIESQVSLKGTVIAQNEESILLDYGQGTITVELDDWDDLEEGELAMPGDQVTVYGTVDDSFYRDRSIEAQSIYVEGINAVLTGPSPYDEEGQTVQHYRQTHFIGPSQYDIEIAGQVTSVDGRTFTIDSGERQMKVDTSMMEYNPMDERGFQQVTEGDWVRASGDLAMNTFEDREIMAESVVTLPQLKGLPRSKVE